MQVCIDVIVQRLGDATAAGIYKLLFTNLDEKEFAACFYALPVCLSWFSFKFSKYLFFIGKCAKRAYESFKSASSDMIEVSSMVFINTILQFMPLKLNQIHTLTLTNFQPICIING